MPLSNDDIKIIVSTIKKPFVNAIFLTGSYAVGTENEESDVDIIVIVENYLNSTEKSLIILNSTGLLQNKNIHAFVYTENEAILNKNIPVSQRINSLKSITNNIVSLYVKDIKKTFYLS